MKTFLVNDAGITKKYNIKISDESSTQNLFKLLNVLAGKDFNISFQYKVTPDKEFETISIDTLK